MRLLLRPQCLRKRKKGNFNPSIALNPATITLNFDGPSPRNTGTAGSTGPGGAEPQPEADLRSIIGEGAEPHMYGNTERLRANGRTRWKERP